MATGLQREVREETGLVINNFHETYKSGHITFFWGELPNENIKLSNEHSAYELKSLDEIFEKGYTINEIFIEAAEIALKQAIKA